MMHTKMESAGTKVARHLQKNGGRFAGELAQMLDLSLLTTENALNSLLGMKEVTRKKVQLPHMAMPEYRYFSVDDEQGEDRSIKITKPAGKCAKVEVSDAARLAANPFQIGATKEPKPEAITPFDYCKPIPSCVAPATIALRFAEWSSGEFTIAGDEGVLINLQPAEFKAMLAYLRLTH